MSASSPIVRSTGAAQITWSRTFPAIPQQVGEARRFLAAILDGRAAAADDAMLCLSELASNAVLHSRSATPGAQFTVRATLKNDQLRVEVSDGGGPWHWPDGGDDEQHGRGLVIVSHLSTAWGRAGTPDTGWTVWYTMACLPVRLPRAWTTVIDGHRLRQLRRERELTQVELAGKAGVSLATVVRLERHPQVSCRSRTLSRLAAALGEQPTRLARSCEPTENSSPLTDKALSASMPGSWRAVSGPAYVTGSGTFGGLLVSNTPAACR